MTASGGRPGAAPDGPGSRDRAGPLDINVLARLVLRDDEAQAAMAHELFQANAGNDGALFVSDVVLVELAWLLKRRYRVDATGIAGVMRALLHNATVSLQSRVAAANALILFENRGVGFPDRLVVTLAHEHGCGATASFDQDMEGLPGVRVLA